MNNTPKLCPICSHPMIKVSYLAAPYPGRTEADPGWDWTCSNLPWKCREAALCARVAKLEEQLQEADAELCFCFRAFQEHGPIWASTPSAAVYHKAQGRQAARKEAPHDR